MTRPATSPGLTRPSAGWRRGRHRCPPASSNGHWSCTAQLTELAKAARQRGWWQRYGEVLHPGFELYLGLEAEATEMHAYVSEWVPGLLQTAEYAHAVLSVEPRPPSDEEIQARVEARLARQAILSGDAPLQYWVVLDEAVLRRAVGGPRVMAEQLRVLASAARRRNIKLQVLP